MERTFHQAKAVCWGRMIEHIKYQAKSKKARRDLAVLVIIIIQRKGPKPKLNCHNQLSCTDAALYTYKNPTLKM